MLKAQIQTTDNSKNHAGTFLSKEVVDFFNSDMVVATLFCQLFYWHTKSKSGVSMLRVQKEGCWWVAKSANEWKDEVGLTRMQTRRAIKVLVDKGVIEHKVWKFDGVPTGHFRFLVLEGKRVILSSTSQILGEGNSPKQPIHLFPVTNPLVPHNQSITETTTEEYKQENKAQALPTQDEPLSLSIEKVEKEKKVEVDKIGKEMKDLQSILKMKAEQAAEKFGVEVAWNKSMASTYGGFHPSMTMKEKAQLKRVKTLAVEAGADPLKVVRWVVENWGLVAGEIRVRVGLDKAPSMPLVGWLSQYASHAVHIYKESQEIVQLIAQSPGLQNSQVVTTKAAKALDPEVNKEEDSSQPYIPTKEEIESTLKLFQKGG